MDQGLLQHVRWLEGCREEMLQTLIGLCDINSGTRNLAGMEQVLAQLVQLYRPLGGELEILETDPVENLLDSGAIATERLGRMLRVTRAIPGRPRVLLCIHYDTVYDADSTFQKCRWLDPQRLNGPGVIDAKAGLVMMWYVLKTLEQSPWAGQIGWQVVINPDEEIGSPASQRLLNDAARAADLGMLFEPTLPNGALVSWRKGVGNFSFVVRGRSAHAGRDFQAGRNAIVAMNRLMLGIHELNTDPEVTFNIGRVSGGGALNVVPDLAIGRVNVRVRTAAQGERVMEQFRGLMEELQRLDGISVEMHGGFTSPPKELIPGTELLQQRIEAAGELVGMPVSWSGSGGGSDGNKFAAAGLPNIDSLGPGGGEIHSHNEYLLADTLVPRTQLSALVLLSLAADFPELSRR